MYVITGLTTIILLVSQSISIHNQYANAKPLPNTHYTLIKAVKHLTSQGELNVEGALLGYWDDSENKNCLYFPKVRFSEKTDFSRHDRFVAVSHGDDVVLEPLVRS